MWLPNNKHEKKDGSGTALIAVAIDKDKNSQTSLKWAIDNLAQKGQTILLLHVKIKPSLFAQSPTNSSRCKITFSMLDLHTKKMKSWVPDSIY